MPNEQKDLIEIVAEILIEIHLMKGVQESQAAELHFRREQLEKLNDKLEKIDARIGGIDARIDTNQRENVQMLNAFGNAVLDRLDAIKNEMKSMNNRIEMVMSRQNFVENQIDENILRRIENLEKTVYGKAG
ncbi:MAG: hypothetical protein MUD08_09850 [Cytophagales bacterium]|jgi:predicted  nucleic acid-binding Zn-ribbon protein|nr:hypothetical protein [Cytophagales bacterium]